jgi:hypothetical protein
MVPDLWRMTMEDVVPPSVVKRTPCSRSPSDTPVAAKNTSWVKVKTGEDAHPRTWHAPKHATNAHLAPAQPGGGEHLRWVQAHRQDRGAVLVVARPKAALDSAAHALQRRSRDDALRAAADAHEHIHPAVRARHRDGCCHVAVTDKTNARARGADVLDQLRVTRPVQHNHLLDASAQRQRRRHVGVRG